MELLKFVSLYDFYSPMLSERQRDVLDLYYNDDLSLSEISSELGITRQGVRDAIKTGESKLNEFEEKLHAVAIINDLKKRISDANDA
ncbi:MAG: hypothetical protein IJS94_00265 [Clostridia bacterium]|nr:hypothetical protein [Clostridia bacterium]